MSERECRREEEGITTVSLHISYKWKLRLRLEWMHTWNDSIQRRKDEYKNKRNNLKEWEERVTENNNIIRTWVLGKKDCRWMNNEKKIERESEGREREMLMSEWKRKEGLTFHPTILLHGRQQKNRRLRERWGWKKRLFIGRKGRGGGRVDLTWESDRNRGATWSIFLVEDIDPSKDNEELSRKERKGEDNEGFEENVSGWEIDEIEKWKERKRKEVRDF